MVLYININETIECDERFHVLGHETFIKNMSARRASFRNFDELKQD